MPGVGGPCRERAAPAHPGGMAAALVVEGLRKRYGHLTAVDGVGFEVAEGEIFGIIGPNGSGKTTTAECAQGPRRPDSGLVRVFGIDPHERSGGWRDWRAPSTLAFAAVGVFPGAVLPTARAAQGIGVLLWFIMLMISGGGPPPEVLSSTLRRVGDFTPLRHPRVALQDAWLGRGVNWAETLVLLAVLVGCAGAALPALRRRS
ncbi:hypothetical protein GCM10010492_58170 [Saccharothrix mutabilis subsp. mutabilis]|uniref:ABC transporter domain-containing protein n=2 Tax=Saccharothrix mutabilis TaxID=33921 RepID=A0ABN0UH61_9PSEU